MAKKKTGGTPKKKAKADAANRAETALVLHPDREQIRTTRKKLEFLEALRKHAGVITHAAREVKIARSQIYVWQEKDPSFAEALQEVNEEAIDFVESKMFELINGVKVEGQVDPDTGEPIVYSRAPDARVIMFYLDRKARHRGYTDRKEIGFTNAQNIVGFIFKP